MANEKKVEDDNFINLEIGTILSNRTKEGMIEFSITKDEQHSVKTQWDIMKAKEIRDMLTEAIEAAISDTLIYKFLTEKVKLPEDQASMMLLDFREIRQGTRGVNWPF